MSEIRANTISDAAGTGPATLTGQSAAKVHLYFDHSTNTVGGSFNVSSVTDSATGLFTVNFTAAFSDATQRAAAGCAIQSGVRVLFMSGPDGTSASSGSFYTVDGAEVAYDSNRAGLSIHGDLA